MGSRCAVFPFAHDCAGVHWGRLGKKAQQAWSRPAAEFSEEGAVMSTHRVTSALAAAAAVPVLLVGAVPAAAGAPPPAAAANTVLGPAAVGTVLDPGARAVLGPARLSGRIHSRYESGWVVELTLPGETEPAYTVSTGQDSTFEFTGVQPGEYVMDAVHPDSGTTLPGVEPRLLHPGDNGNVSLVVDGPPPDQLPDMLAPLTGRVEGVAPDATSVVVEVLHDRDDELVQVSSAPVAEDGTFSVDPRVIEGYALPIQLRAVQELPDGSTEAVYHGQSPAAEGATPIVPAEGVQEDYRLSFAEAHGRPAPAASARPTASPSTPAAEDATAAAEEVPGAGPPATLWAVLGAAALAVSAAVAVVLRRRAG